jgi:hypothetical protein
MLIMENVNEVKEEIVKMKGYVTPKFVVVAAVAAGTGVYLVGRSKGFKHGFDLGQSEGYKKGIKDASELVKLEKFGKR